MLESFVSFKPALCTFSRLSPVVAATIINNSNNNRCQFLPLWDLALITPAVHGCDSRCSLSSFLLQPCLILVTASWSTWPTWTKPRTPQSGRTPSPARSTPPMTSSSTAGSRAGSPRWDRVVNAWLDTVGVTWYLHVTGHKTLKSRSDMHLPLTRTNAFALVVPCLKLSYHDTTKVLNASRNWQQNEWQMGYHQHSRGFFPFSRLSYSSKCWMIFRYGLSQLHQCLP